MRDFVACGPLCWKLAIEWDFSNRACGVCVWGVRVCVVGCSFSNGGIVSPTLAPLY